MARRKPNELTAVEWRLLRHRLSVKRDDLSALIRRRSADAMTFELACDIRDRAQELASCLLRLQDMPMWIQAAENNGVHPLHFSLADCGLEE